MNFNLDFDFREDIEDAVLRVVRSGQYANGPELKRFEKDWAAFNELPFAVGVGSGTDALRLALLACGVKPGDEVISPAFNVGYTAQAVVSIGAKNVFVDIDPDTWLMDKWKVDDAVTPRTKAIIPVHLFGQMVDMEGLSHIARRNGCVLIEDAAQCHGASYMSFAPGYFSDAACYSHYPTKNLGCLGEGGSVLTRLPIIADRVRLLRDAGRVDRYVHLMPGVNSMLDEIQAAILNVKLPHLRDQNVRRVDAANYYHQKLEGVGDIKIQKVAHQAWPVNHLCVITTKKREAVLENFRKNEIPALVHYPCTLARQPFAVADALDQGPFPIADRIAASCLSLPLYPSITQTDQDKVIAAIKEVYA